VRSSLLSYYCAASDIAARVIPSAVFLDCEGKVAFDLHFEGD
jgi:hypothetical protein